MNTTLPPDMRLMRPMHAMGAAGLATELERQLAESRSRLLRIARLQGIAPDAADDVVQETLLEAWRSLDHLRDPERLSAWLDGICRNVCRRQLRAEGRINACCLPLDAPIASAPSDAREEASNITDALAADPFEELDRDELAALVDRGLGYLPTQARDALELCYLAEMPQREAAERLCLSISALEVRLHRARRRLRTILSTTLRDEADAFGLLDIGDEIAGGWHETRIRCFMCGRRRLSGRFDAMPDGRTNLLLRCPACYRQYGANIVTSSNPVALGNVRSFGPAYKRVARFGAKYLSHALTQHAPLCDCGLHPVRLRIVRFDEVGEPTFPDRHYVVSECLTFGRSFSWIASAVWYHPAVQDFIAGHPYCVAEPEAGVSYAGQDAYRFRLTDLRSASRLTLFTSRDTLHVLATFIE